MVDFESIFTQSGPDYFIEKSLEIFHYQYFKIPSYKKFVDLLGVNPQNVSKLNEIPFLPIEFFKNEIILDNLVESGSKILPISENRFQNPFEIIFSSSGTTGSQTSKHFVRSLKLYEKSFFESFSLFYGNIRDYVLLALLPSYLEREGSSLIYMVQKLIEKGANPKSGFYLDDYETLKNHLQSLREQGKKTILMGVTYALLDFVEKYPDFHFPELIIMETGGMKGKRKEMVREELHSILNFHFKTSHIHSEYGMTELLSQAYSNGRGVFYCPPWMKILIRETSDPRSYTVTGRAGGINIIDLANLHSCSFIATQDLGKSFEDGSFEILGRFDSSDIRGCNLLVE